MKVQTYDTPQATPAGQPTPYAQAPGPAVFGAELGGAVDQSAAQVQQLAAEEHQKTSATVVSKALLATGDAINQGLYDKDTGFLNQQGENGVNPAPVLDSLKKSVGDIREKLATEEQQKAFDAAVGPRLLQAHESLQRHAGQQLHQVAKETAEGHVQQALMSAGLNYNQPTKVADAIENAWGPLKLFLTKNLGLPREKVTQEMEKFQDSVYAKAVTTYLDNRDGMGAAAYLKTALPTTTPGGPKTIGERLNESDPALMKRVATGELEQQASVNASKFVETSAGMGGYPDERAAYAKWSALPEGPLKDATLTRLKSRLVDFKEAAKQQEDNNLGTLELSIRNSRGVLDQSSSAFAALSPLAKEKAKALQDTVLREHRSDRSTARREQMDLDTTIVRNFKALDPESQLQKNVDTDFPDASPMARGSLRDAQKSAKTMIEKAHAIPWEKTKEAVAEVLRAYAPEGPEGKAFIADAQAKMFDWWNAQVTQSKTGLPPTRAEAMKQLGEQMQWGNTHKPGTFMHALSGDRFRFQVKPGEEFYPEPDAEQKYKAPAAPPDPNEKVRMKLPDGRTATGLRSEFPPGSVEVK